MVRTRFAPSPTGFLHIGSLRTALYAYALAKHDKGDFILRIEDTDQKREVAGATTALQETLGKFGLNWDEYYLQSDRQKTGIYHQAAEKLVKDGHAFYCQCPPKNAKEQGYSAEVRDPCRKKNLTSGAIKLKAPDGQTVSYHDFVHKKAISWDTNTVYDATLLKSDGFPTYHLAVVVDDHLMEISHVIRAEDWISSTPKHILLFEMFGWDAPVYAHIPIIRDESHAKLAKRRGDSNLNWYKEEGFLPGALINYLCQQGCSKIFTQKVFY